MHTNGVSPPTSSPSDLCPGQIYKHVKQPEKRFSSPWAEQQVPTASPPTPKLNPLPTNSGISLVVAPHPPVPSAMSLSTGSISTSKEALQLVTPLSSTR